MACFMEILTARHILMIKSGLKLPNVINCGKVFI